MIQDSTSYNTAYRLTEQKTTWKWSIYSFDKWAVYVWF